MSNLQDPRLGALIQAPTDAGLATADVVIFGVPTDEGIIRNGGRPGAAHAPDAIRTYLHKLTPFTGTQSLESLAITDLGNVTGNTLEEVHANAKELSKKLIASNKIVVALGGGHDVTYPLAAGFAEADRDTTWSLVNVDAHLDVRPKKNDQHHSGSSFRLLVEEGYLSGLHVVEFGIQPFAMAREHYDWALQEHISVMLYDEIASRVIPTFADLAAGGIDYLSFDIDSVCSSDAPGCSAPSPTGLSGFEACRIAELAGMHGTRMLDIVEVSPAHDIDGRTCKLAARMIAYFLSGVIANRNS